MWKLLRSYGSCKVNNSLCNFNIDVVTAHFVNVAHPVALCKIKSKSVGNDGIPIFCIKLIFLRHLIFHINAIVTESAFP